MYSPDLSKEYVTVKYEGLREKDPGSVFYFLMDAGYNEQEKRNSCENAPDINYQ
jgi:hypothetical protein